MRLVVLGRASSERESTRCASRTNRLTLFPGSSSFFPWGLLRRALDRRDDRLNRALVSSGSSTPESSAMDLTAPRTLITFAHN